MLLITPLQIKALTPMTNNVDNTLFQTQIEIAQLRFIKPKLGKELYEQLCNQLETNTLTPANETLLSMLLKPLAHYAVGIFLPNLHAKIRDKGILLETGGDSVNVSTSDLELIRQDYFEKANDLMREVLEYLDDNRASYTLYKNYSTEIKPVTFIKINNKKHSYNERKIIR